MAETIEMPKLSDTMTEGTVVKWHKKEGDKVESGEVIAEIETDKATMDLEAFDAGVLLKIVAAEGAAVPCRQPIAYIGKPGEKIEEAPAPSAAEGKSKAKAKPPEDGKAASEDKGEKPAAGPAPVEPGPSSEKRVKASPLARKIASDRGIDLARVSGTGPGGRIVRQDVLSFDAAGGSPGGASLLPTGPVAKEEKIRLTNVRQTIARRLLESKTQIPHFYLEVEVDAGPLLDLRAQANESLATLPKPVKFSVNDFVLRACALAMRKVPAVNAAWAGDSIIQYGGVHLAFAVAIPDGLITPVIRNAQGKSLKQISDEAKALAGRAREGKLKPDEYTGGTFTVSNLGMLGIDRFAAIINPPQAAILAVGNVLKKPVVGEGDRLTVGRRMSLTLSCDHRVVDGAVGAQYLAALRELIEKPAALLL